MENPGTHLGTPSNTAVVATERDTLVFDDDVPQVFVSLADVHAFDGLGCLTGVLGGQNKPSFWATAPQNNSSTEILTFAVNDTDEVLNK